ncbi:hypothetical protein DFQ27_008961 [Actinomortierella ambigua]|uniref:FAD-binding domain-containing protein n=1 Tax=Actinomortierella ambigua TaxID=1343610 RepID=A0A9P6TY46_9FUNG|nr:hypothetical protein DFQ27_008961 [Actinomortierella ambigua]
MPSIDLQVTIVGMGIAGALLAVCLERAGIEYIVLERAHELKALGTGMTITASTIRIFDQLGMLDELHAIALPIATLRYFKQNHSAIGVMDVSPNKKKFGYESLIFPRPELLKLLVSKIPKEKIYWGKKIVRTSQDTKSVKVFCLDGTEFESDILVGADGAYSAVRQSLYKNLLKKGVALKPSDLAPLNFQMHCNVGVATNLDPQKYPILNAPSAELHAILGDTHPYTLWVSVMKNNSVSWTLGGNPSAPATKADLEWEYRSAQGVPQGVRDIKLTIGGTLGDLMDKTKTELTSAVNLEDKLYERWYDGRTILVGDSVHKLVPWGGQGATQAMLDAVDLANVLYELPSNTPAAITRAFKAFYDHRFPDARAAHNSSVTASKLTGGRGFMADLYRAIALTYMPPVLYSMTMNKQHYNRPILSYLPPPPAKGTLKPNPKILSAYKPGELEKLNQRMTTVSI